MIAIDDLLDSDALLASTNGDRYTVFVGAANEENFLALKTKVADVNVGRYVYSCEVTDMNRAVGVRKGRGHEGAFKFLLFHWVIVLLLVSDWGSQTWLRTLTYCFWYCKP